MKTGVYKKDEVNNLGHYISCMGSLD